ncbi:hypothetical protein JL720_4482 [Aureococcus anophagefferens]|nr:hypothetical protein JL720_4482 [Aureococcus anophagefferens]
MLCALPVADAENVDDLVDRVLGSDRASDAKLLLELVALLESIAEHASVVRVREKVLEIEEREFGPDHVQVAITLANLGNAHGELGDNAKKRDLLERALAIFEREYGRDDARVAGALRELAGVYGRLGDDAKKRDLLERALAIKERALAIKEREYGRDHARVATTLLNLEAHGELGDNAKKRDLLERARDLRASAAAASSSSTPRGKFVTTKSMSFLDYRERAFRAVEQMIAPLLAAPEDDAFPVGAEVVLRGLAKAPELEGAHGIVAQTPVDLKRKGRVAVTLFDEAGDDEDPKRRKTAGGVRPLPKVGHAEMDDEHAELTALLETPRGPVLEALAAVRTEFAEHSAHEEALMAEVAAKGIAKAVHLVAPEDIAALGDAIHDHALHFDQLYVDAVKRGPKVACAGGS